MVNVPMDLLKRLSEMRPAPYSHGVIMEDGHACLGNMHYSCPICELKKYATGELVA
jgi:hypothetical protein